LGTRGEQAVATHDFVRKSKNRTLGVPFGTLKAILLHVEVLNELTRIRILLQTLKATTRDARSLLAQLAQQ
jgi:hypothetical protein